MGCFDSLYIKCPKCGSELEFQSKSGPCELMDFTAENKDLPAQIAIGMQGDVVKCAVCDSNWKLECNIPEIVTVKLAPTTKKERYPGNFVKTKIDETGNIVKVQIGIGKNR
jgi:hypothetical protein